jgi:hypothetical protein
MRTEAKPILLFLVAIEALLNASGLTNPIAQIKQLSSPYSTTTNYNDVVYLGGVQQKNPLHTNALENAPDSYGLVDPTVAASNDDPFVGLHPLLVAFLNFDAYLNGVADVQFGQVALEVFGLDRAEYFLGVHGGYQNSRILILAKRETFV